MAWITPLLERDRIPFTTIVARLAEEGYKPWEIRRLTRWYIKRVIFHPRERDGRLSMPDPGEQTWTQEGQIRRTLLRRNCPWWLIEKRAQEIEEWWLSQQKPRRED